MEGKEKMEKGEGTPMINWEFNRGEPDRFGEPPGPSWEPIGFPEAPEGRPFMTSNFVADRQGLVSGDNLKVEHIAGIEDFESGAGLTPDSGQRKDTEFMRNIRAHADAVMWGANTLRRQPGIIPDLLDNSELHNCRKKHGLPAYPPLILVTNSGELDFSLRAFHAEGLRTIVLTNEAAAQKLRGAIAGTNAEIVGIGSRTLDMARGLKFLREEESMQVVVCEGGHNLIVSLHEQRLLDEAFLTTSDRKLDAAKVKNPGYIFDFQKEGANHIARGSSGEFQFDRWRFKR